MSLVIIQLPELVRSALCSACNSGKHLSWRVQENEKGVLIQLVWKAQKERSSVSGMATRVGSNWNHTAEPRHPLSGHTNRVGASNWKSRSIKHSNESRKPVRKKKISPSRARRNARRLQALLERKQVLKADLPASQKEPDSISRENTVIAKDKSVSQDEHVSQENTDENISDLKTIINNEAICV